MNLIPVKLSVTNCFLINTGNKYILIDTGYEDDWELFLNGLEKVNVTISQISHIILTHHHDDHCGLLHKILKENNSIRVVMSPLCKALILKGENDQTHGGGLLNKRVDFLIKRKQLYVSLVLRKKISKEKNLKFLPYKFRECDIIVTDQTKLRDIDIPLDGMILETPGHTIDSISIIFPDGDCIVGDAAANMLRFAGTKYCVIFICNINEYYKSWQKIISAHAHMIFPAHGRPFTIDKLEKNLFKNKEKNLVN